LWKNVSFSYFSLHLLALLAVFAVIFGVALIIRQPI